MTPTTDLQKLLAEAKPAPWTFSKRNAYGVTNWSVTTPLLVPGGYFSVRIPNPLANESDARLIAMAPDLAARVLELEAENARLREAIADARLIAVDAQLRATYQKTALERISDLLRAALKGGEI